MARGERCGPAMSDGRVSPLPGIQWLEKEQTSATSRFCSKIVVGQPWPETGPSNGIEWESTKIRKNSCPGARRWVARGRYGLGRNLRRVGRGAEFSKNGARKTPLRRRDRRQARGY